VEGRYLVDSEIKIAADRFVFIGSSDEYKIVAADMAGEIIGLPNFFKVV